ncbi:MAG: nuclear transport factor 2 family protein [Solirubrobacterales bacterium]|nr:nuclear transport factor 2 family protein [Solirubrobacterales bacterium]
MAYFAAWQARDADRFRGLLADDVSWEGPSWRAITAEQCMAAFHQASSLVTSVDIQHIWVDGDDVLTWIEVRTGDESARPIANWTHVTDGRITRIRATSDLLPSS